MRISRFSFFAALVSEPKVSLEEPSFVVEVETNSPSNEQDGATPLGPGTKTDDPTQEMSNEMVDPSTSSNDG
jgi:hypothetical protein